MQSVTRFPDGARVDVEFGPYVLRTDQPPEGGGEGTAPTPFATFLASIAACAGFHVLAFCRARGLRADDIRILETTESDPTTKMVTAIHLAIQVPPEFPEKYRAALVRAAGQCTIKRHLEAIPVMTIQAQLEVSRSEGISRAMHLGHAAT
jgi:ribosomal protein S12 methylthiotransferase accessory factor